MHPMELIHDIKYECARLGYAFFEGEEYDLNFFGIRHPDYENLFNDLLGCAWRADGEWHLRLWPGTTDPGGYYLRQPMKKEGTAILAAGQHRGLWRLGKHQGKYEALVQTGGTVPVYRDGDRDLHLDFCKTEIDRGWFGINMHRAGLRSQEVDKWSAGCQVHGTRGGFEEAMALARLQQVYNPSWKSYSYTLFTLMDEPLAPKSPSLEKFFSLRPGWFFSQE